ncbi:uncharacterized protein LOC132390075 isoform X2 [Hypanus sabinus]|uniref:uncharacterized protein LOC132390075 isoform X2 n=1 Tax=Hypanus sabinus TaxID=79690 RepID=UPI0028C5065D|nr:uncharacterized protein LOC132390075 isoform X2 [Hypanus sabinus]
MLTFPGWAVIFFLCVEAGLERWIVHGIRIGRGSSPPRAASRGGRSDHSLRSGTDKIHATCGERFIGRKAHNWKQTTTEDEGTATSEPARGLRASTGENPSDSEIPLIQSGESLISGERFIGRKAHNWKRTRTENDGTATSEPARGRRSSIRQNPSDSEFPLKVRRKFGHCQQVGLSSTRTSDKQTIINQRQSESEWTQI